MADSSTTSCRSDGEIPLPDWSVFDDEDLIDMNDDLREAFRARAIPEPAGVAIDKHVLSSPARRSVPATVIACEFSTERVRGWMAEDEEPGELASLDDYELIDLPTGHLAAVHPSDRTRGDHRRSCVALTGRTGVLT